MMSNPYQQYRTNQVQTAGTGDLVVLLYDGAIRFLNRALVALEEKRLDGASADLIRGQEIVLELNKGLDLERGELAVNLGRLYDFFYRTLVEANIEKDAEKIKHVLAMLDQIRGAWTSVVRGGTVMPADRGATTVAGGMAA